jgi:hypothetical protein
MEGPGKIHERFRRDYCYEKRLTLHQDLFVYSWCGSLVRITGGDDTWCTVESNVVQPGGARDFWYRWWRWCGSKRFRNTFCKKIAKIVESHTVEPLRKLLQRHYP